MKRTLAAVLLAAALVGAPKLVEAQWGSICDSPGMNWCFTPTEFHYVESVAGTYDTSLTGYWSGPALGGYYNFIWNYYVALPGFGGGAIPSDAFLPGQLVSSTGHTNATPSFSGTPDDFYSAISVYWYAAGAQGGGCGAPFTTADCYHAPVSVPEPDTSVLLLSGIFGLGLVVWRKRQLTA